ncbi:MAG: DUF6265 family protein [Saprospiraceae bacterium]
MFIRLLVFATLFLPYTVDAQIDDPAQIFRELRGLDGTWFMPTDRGDRLEIWAITNDSTLSGSALRIKPENGDTVLLENLRIELRGDEIHYLTIARGQSANKPVVFDLTDADYEGYTFENAANDDPTKIHYRLLGNRELQINTEGKRSGRTVTNEYVYEREFSPGAVEFRLRAGVNMHTLKGTGQFPADTLFNDQSLGFGFEPGWEIGSQACFKGRGGYITINLDIALAGKASKVASNFYGDTATYVRDGKYRTTWLTIGLQPELTFRRGGRLSVFAGPYFGILLNSRLKGTQLPNTENRLFKANNDFKKTDLGLVGGLQYKLNLGKKDLGGILGARFQLGLKNLDNLYSRDCNDPAFCNGQVKLVGFSLYYSVNLLKS